MSLSRYHFVAVSAGSLAYSWSIEGRGWSGKLQDARVSRRKPVETVEQAELDSDPERGRRSKSHDDPNMSRFRSSPINGIKNDNMIKHRKASNDQSHLTAEQQDLSGEEKVFQKFSLFFLEKT